MATELKKGISRFVLVGKAIVNGANMLEDAKTSNKGWVYTQSTFGVDTTKDGEPQNIVYPRIEGRGYDSKKGIIYTVANEADKNGSRATTVKYANRNDEDTLSSVANFAKYYADLGEGRKEFLTSVDLLEYVKENLAQGEHITVTGNVEYGVDDVEEQNRVYRNYVVTGIYLNQEREVKDEDGNTKLERRQPTAFVEQEYLINSDSLDKNWKKQLDKGEDVFASVQVLEYIGSVKSGNSYVDYKHVIPVSQAIRISEDANEKLVNLIFGVKGDTIRLAKLFNKIIDGYDIVKSEDVEISDDVKALIEMGVMSEEDVEKEFYVRGGRRSEIVLNEIGKFPFTDDDGNKKLEVFIDDRYEISDLKVPSVGGEVVKDTVEDDDADIDLDAIADDDNPFGDFSDFFADEEE